MNHVRNGRQEEKRHPQGSPRRAGGPHVLFLLMILRGFPRWARVLSHVRRRGGLEEYLSTQLGAQSREKHHSGRILWRRETARVFPDNLDEWNQYTRHLLKFSLLTYTSVGCHLSLLENAVIKALRNSSLFLLWEGWNGHFFVIKLPIIPFMSTLRKDSCLDLKQRITSEKSLFPQPISILTFWILWLTRFCCCLYSPLENLEIILWPTSSKVLTFYSIHFKKLFIMKTIFKHIKRREDSILNLHLPNSQVNKGTSNSHTCFIYIPPTSHVTGLFGSNSQTSCHFNYIYFSIYL